MKKTITRTQVLKWHDASKDIPEMNRVVLIKVPHAPPRQCSNILTICKLLFYKMVQNDNRN